MLALLNNVLVLVLMDFFSLLSSKIFEGRTHVLFIFVAFIVPDIVYCMILALKINSTFSFSCWEAQN